MMNKILTLGFCAALVIGTLSIPGCGDDGPAVIQAPELSAEDIAQAEAKRAEYEKQMKESYGKGN